MGLFGKLKQNFTRGGVKITMQAPASTSMQDPSLPVEVTITATDSPQVITKVRAEIIAQSRDMAFGSPTGSNTNSTQTTQETVARAENAETFTLQPGESRTVQLAIVMNAGANLAAGLPEGSGMQQVAGAFQKLQQLTSAMSSASYEYHIKAVADVEGIALDPSCQQPIQVRKPGEIGAAINL